MKLLVLFLLTLAAAVVVDSNHTFIGTNVQRPLVFHNELKFSSKIFGKRVEYFNYTLPVIPHIPMRYITGILAYDLTNSGATANVTDGGIGANFVRLRMKSDSGKSLRFDIYIYA